MVSILNVAAMAQVIKQLKFFASRLTATSLGRETYSTFATL